MHLKNLGQIDVVNGTFEVTGNIDIEYFDTNLVNNPEAELYRPRFLNRNSLSGTHMMDDLLTIKSHPKTPGLCHGKINLK